MNEPEIPVGVVGVLFELTRDLCVNLNRTLLTSTGIF